MEHPENVSLAVAGDAMREQAAASKCLAESIAKQAEAVMTLATGVHRLVDMLELLGNAPGGDESDPEDKRERTLSGELVDPES